MGYGAVLRFCYLKEGSKCCGVVLSECSVNQETLRTNFSQRTSRRPGKAADSQRLQRAVVVSGLFRESLGPMGLY